MLHHKMLKIQCEELIGNQFKTIVSLLYSQIFCSVSTFFLDSPNNRSSWVESQEFFAGIRVNCSNLLDYIVYLQ